ncbi:MAG: RNA polymerase sigma factor [Candidatus Neomarinimicrobiota bacterium]
MKAEEKITEQFLQLLKPHYQAAASYCRGLNPDHHDDILQEALLKALRGFPSLRDHSQFKSWLFRIITREAATFHRRYFWRRFLEWDSAQWERHHDAVAGLQTEELYQLLHALDHLPRKKRETILLFEIGGFAITEIAAFYLESESAVKSRLARTKRELKQWLIAGLRESTKPRTMLEMYDEVATDFSRSRN